MHRGARFSGLIRRTAITCEQGDAEMSGGVRTEMSVSERSRKNNLKSEDDSRALCKKQWMTSAPGKTMGAGGAVMRPADSAPPLGSRTN
jgi:hypothetical protein